MINEFNNLINGLEDLLIKANYPVMRLLQLKHSYVEKHNYLIHEYELIAFYNDYFSHLKELKIVYAGFMPNIHVFNELCSMGLIGDVK